MWIKLGGGNGQVRTAILIQVRGINEIPELIVGCFAIKANIIGSGKEEIERALNGNARLSINQMNTPRISLCASSITVSTGPLRSITTLSSMPARI